MKTKQPKSIRLPFGEWLQACAREAMESEWCIEASWPRWQELYDMGLSPNAAVIAAFNEHFKEGDALKSQTGYPPLPAGMTREDCINGLKEMRDRSAKWERRLHSDFVRWPDLDALLDYIEAHGFPPPAMVSESNDEFRGGGSEPSSAANGSRLLTGQSTSRQTTKQAQMKWPLFGRHWREQSRNANDDR